MRKLLWLIPLFFLLPAIVGVSNLYWWFFTGAGFMPHFTEAHGAVMGVSAFASFITGLFVAPSNQ